MENNKFKVKIDEEIYNRTDSIRYGLVYDYYKFYYEELIMNGFPKLEKKLRNFFESLIRQNNLKEEDLLVKLNIYLGKYDVSKIIIEYKVKFEEEFVLFTIEKDDVGHTIISFNKSSILSLVKLYENQIIILQNTIDYNKESLTNILEELSEVNKKINEFNDKLSNIKNKTITKILFKDYYLSKIINLKKKVIDLEDIVDNNIRISNINNELLATNIKARDYFSSFSCEEFKNKIAKEINEFFKDDINNYIIQTH